MHFSGFPSPFSFHVFPLNLVLTSQFGFSPAPQKNLASICSRRCRRHTRTGRDRQMDSRGRGGGE